MKVLLCCATLFRLTCALKATDLKVDYSIQPITVQNAAPFFSFAIDDAGARGVMSEGYELEVSELKDNGEVSATLWKSGAVTGNQTTFIKYPSDAPALKSNTDYQWSVKVSPGSDPATVSTFSTALFETKDWEPSVWVEAATAIKAAQMRKEFTLPAGKITRARAFFAMPGYGTMTINGNSVDGDAGTRTWSQYDKRTIYGCYDIKDALVAGAGNAIGVYAGQGWYGHWGYGPPAIRVLISVTIDGERIFHGSDGTWTETPGPVQANDEYNGETYDARLETPGWTSAGFTPGAEKWSPVKATGAAPKLAKAKLDAMKFPPIDVIHVFTAKWWKEPSPGVYVFDFEQNLSGWIKLVLKSCTAGTAITFRHAELLQHPPYGPVDGNIYDGNYRGAKATDVYICKGDDINGEEWQPRFTQHGFRYVEVTGLEAPPTLDMLSAINVRSAVDQAGTISFSDPMMNNVQHNLLWGQATNLMMVPTDCDQRDERLGWTGDSALTAEEALNNFDLGSFYHNWAEMIDESSPNGAVGDTIPTRPGGGNDPASKSADASWASVFPSIVWGLLKYNGDTEVKKFWPGLTRFMDNEWGHIGNTTADKDIKKMFAQFGDWCPPPPARKVNAAFTAGFSFVNDLAAVVELARHVGSPSDVTKYSTIQSEARKMFHTAWWDPTNHYYGDGGQTAQVLALQIGAAPDAATKKSALDTLVASVLKAGNHTTCGIIGWRWELDVLSANGYADLAYSLITQQTYPGYGYEILNEYEPATTVWELWNGDTEGPGMNSRDHIMFGGPGRWIYNYVGGISQTDESIGFEHVILAPPAQLIEQAVTASGPSAAANATISSPLEFTSSSHRTLKGEIVLEWSLPQHKATDGQCDVEGEGASVQLSCPGSTIKAMAFSEYGVFSGDCDKGLKYGSCQSNATFKSFVSECCVGKEACEYECKENDCTCSTNKKTLQMKDPCFGTEKKTAGKVTCTKAPSAGGAVLNMKVAVPPGSDAQLVVPLLGAAAADVVITENNKPVFTGGKYVAGVEGVTGAVASGTAITITHGSGQYAFVRTG